MTGSDLVNIALENSAPVQDPEKLQREFDLALKEDRIYFLPEGAGFITFENKNGRLLVNKCVIKKEFRSRFSLLKARHFFRKISNGIQIYWRSHRRNRMCYVK